MKNLFLFVAVAGVFSLASCSKDRTCTCTDTYSSGGSSSTTTSTITYLDSKKGDARQNCIGTKSTGTDYYGNAYTETTECKLK